MALSLSKEETLSKINLRKEEVHKICLSKSNAGGLGKLGDFAHLTSRVAVVLDTSGSMSQLYKNGVVQETLERLLPIAMQFDDDGQMEVWSFDTSPKRLPSVSINNIYGYIDTYLPYNRIYGGTDYGAAIDDIVRKFIDEEPAKLPTYVIFITDGETGNKERARREIIGASFCPIFWQFVGIGNDKFAFLSELDSMPGRYVDNANFLKINNLTTVSDDDIYNGLLFEYPSWLAEPKVQNMIATGQRVSNSDGGNASVKKKKLFGFI